MRVNRFRLPEDRGLQGADGGALVAQTLIDAANQEKGFGARRLNRQHTPQQWQRFVIAPVLIEFLRLREQFGGASGR